jgi:hypothetical protein
VHAATSGSARVLEGNPRRRSFHSTEIQMPTESEPPLPDWAEIYRSTYRELVRYLELLLLSERDPRRLLPVAQGGVEDLYSVLLVAVHVVFLFVGPT